MATSLSPGTGLPASWIDNVDDVTVAQRYPLGQHRMEHGKIYKYVQYIEGTAAVDGVAGEVTYYYTLDGYKSHLVSSDLSDGLSRAAGVMQAVMSNEEYGWIQIKGAATLSIALDTATDGAVLTPVGCSDGSLDIVAAVTEQMVGFAGDASDKEICCDFPW